jgi:hypothetical protein
VASDGSLLQEPRSLPLAVLMVRNVGTKFRGNLH